MKNYIILIVLLHSCLIANSQTVRVVQLEQTLRWLSEYNFPNFLMVAEFENSIKDEIVIRLERFFPNADIISPDHISYRTITYFGKTKIKLPQPASEDFQVAIASSITRETVGYAVVWNMKVLVRQNKKVILEKEVEHELEPYSISIRFSNHPWMDQDEFKNIYILLLEECLGIREQNAIPIALGSPEIIRRNIAAAMPISRVYTLAVTGGMMEPSATRYRVLRDSLEIGSFFYRPTNLFIPNFSFNIKEIFANLFTQISGIETQYRLESKEHRTGIIYSPGGSDRKVRLDWLQENIISTDDVVIGSRIISPITGLYFEEESLISRFMFMKEIRKLEELTIHNLQFQMDEDVDESIYTIFGLFNAVEFSLVYREVEELIFIKVDNELQAILSLININPESQTFGRTKLTKNKTFLVPASKGSRKREVDVSAAEKYHLYTSDGVEDEDVLEMGHFLLLLFFAIGSVD